MRFLSTDGVSLFNSLTSPYASVSFNQEVSGVYEQPADSNPIRTMAIVFVEQSVVFEYMVISL